jgi:YVTN family beta-propeller protein
VIDTATNSAIGTIPVGAEPSGIAITPDGSRAYVSNRASNTVSVIDVAAGAVLGTPIPVGSHPEGVAISSDGSRAYVAQQGGVAVIDTGSGTVFGVLKDELGPSRIAISPDGAYAFVTNNASNSVSVFSLAYGVQVGVPVPSGTNPTGIAIADQGSVFVASSSDNTVSVIDAERHTGIGTPIPGFSLPSRIAISPGGARAYVTNGGEASVSVLDTSIDRVVSQIPVGAGPSGIAIVPDQPPVARFSASSAKQAAGRPASFDAAASSDPDGQIASYAWSFGDGHGEEGPGPVIEHTYAAPGDYRVTLTVTDAEGCSTALVFRGATALCNGSQAAATAQSVHVIDDKPPLFLLSATRRQPLRRRIAVFARCPKERCKVRLAGMLDTVSGPASRRRIHSSRKAGSAKATLPSGVRDRLTLELSPPGLAAARSALADSGRVTLRVTGVATDAEGNKARRKRTIKLVLAGHGKKKSRGARL